MLGKKSSLIALNNYLLKEKSIKNTTDTEFCQGNTMRWGIAWSYHDFQLQDINFKKKEKQEMPLSESYSLNYEILKEEFLKDKSRVFDLMIEIFTYDLKV
jgi:hypothetical protein